jgi:hypothetical protein
MENLQIPTITVYVTRNLDTWSYNLPLEDRRIIKSIVPEAIPSPMVEVFDNVRLSFSQIYGDVLKQIIPFLTGLNANNLSRFCIQILDTNKNETYNFNGEQK